MSEFVTDVDLDDLCLITFSSHFLSQISVRMNQEKGKEEFVGISSDLLSVSKRLSKQISSEKKSVKVLEAELKRRKYALGRLSKQKEVVEKVCKNLGHATNEHVTSPTRSSSSSLSENELMGDESSVSVSGGVLDY